jgi:hypothetical protein
MNRRITARAVKWGVVVTAAAGIAALASSGAHEIVFDVYLLCIGAVILLALVRTTRARLPAKRPSQFDAALAAMRRPEAETGEPSLVRELELSTYNGFHFHSRLRPLLRDIAAHRLRSRYGVELDLEPARARELVGNEAWDVVRPDRPGPDDRMAAGPSFADLRVVVEELEAI